MPLLYPYFNPTLPLLCPYFAPTLPLLHPYFTPTLPLLYQYSTPTLPLLYPCSTLILPLLCPYSAPVLFLLYPYFTSTLPRLCPALPLLLYPYSPSGPWVLGPRPGLPLLHPCLTPTYLNFTRVIPLLYSCFAPWLAARAQLKRPWLAVLTGTLWPGLIIAIIRKPLARLKRPGLGPYINRDLLAL